eukprot:s726_g21.t2
MSDEAVDERFFLFEVDSVQIVVPGLQRGISCMKLDGVHRSMRTLTATAAVCLSESLPAEDNQDPDVQNLFEADEEMQAPEGSKPDEEDVLFAPKRKLYSCRNDDVVWEGPIREVKITNGQISTYDMFLFQGDDPLLHALEGTWSAIFNGTFECKLGLQLGSPDFTTCHLGDFLAFCLSYGASPRMGTNRLFCLTLKILGQIGEFLSEPVKQMSCLTPCDKRKLPIVKPYQRKQKLPEAEIGEATDVSDDVRLGCLAVIKDSCLAISKLKSKSLTIITDAADVAGLTALEDPGRFGPFGSGDRFKASTVYVGQVDVGFKLQVLELTAPALFPRAVMSGLEQKALDIVWHAAT